MTGAAQHTAPVRLRLVLAAGMQKAGSSWFFNLLNDLLVAGGWDDAFQVRDRFALGAVLRGENCFLGAPRASRLWALRKPLLQGRRFVVKTHSAPNAWVRFGQRAGWLRPIYIFRDPRDVVVSAYAHGERARAAGESRHFGQLETIEDAIAFALRLMPIWQAWARHPGVVMTRYETLRADPVRTLCDIRDGLKLATTDDDVARIVARYVPEHADSRQRSALHFHSGRTGRWRAVLTPAQQALCAARFGPYLRAMGYASD